MDTTHGKYLGVDYGDRRTGIAECDVSGLLASGITTVSEGGMRKTAQRVAREATSRGCKKIVIGLPRNMDGSEGPRADLYRAFAEQVEEVTGLKPVLWDERRTTIEAHAILHTGGKKMKDHRKNVDAVAATLILEGYLTRRKRG